MNIVSKNYLQKFLGIAQYYARFIPDLSSKTVNLRAMLLSKDRSLTWSQQAVNDANLIKQAQALVRSELLVPFDSTLETIVTTDASGIALGVVLSQVQKDAFASKSLSECEINYSSLVLETLACVWAIERWHTYLWGRKFLLITHHNQLTS